MFEAEEPDFQRAQHPQLLISNESSWRQQRLDNARASAAFLASQGPFLNSAAIVELHRIQNNQIYSHAGKLLGQRWNPWFDPDDSLSYFALCSKARIPTELLLLDAQMLELTAKPLSDPEKISALTFQCARLYAIHPFNDGQKRIVRSLIAHYARCLGFPGRTGLDQGVPIPESDVAQAVFSDMPGHFAAAIAKSLHAPVSPLAFNPKSLAPFRILPTRINTALIPAETLKSCIEKFRATQFANYPIVEAILPIDQELAHSRLSPESLNRAAPAPVSPLHATVHLNLMAKEKKLDIPSLPSPFSL